MNATFQWEQRLAGLARPLFGSPAVRFLAYLGLCAAYLQGGLVKLTDFPGALAEMAHFGLAPGPVFAVLVIVLELLASAMILVGRLRWLGGAGAGRLHAGGHGHCAALLGNGARAGALHGRQCVL